MKVSVLGAIGLAPSADKAKDEASPSTLTTSEEQNSVSFSDSLHSI